MEALCKTTQGSLNTGRHDSCTTPLTTTGVSYHPSVAQASDAYSTAQLQDRGRVISMRRAEQDYGVKFGIIADKYAR